MIGQPLKRPYLSLIFAVFGTAFSFVGHGQALYPDQPANRNLILAEEQFRQEHFAMASQSARQFLDATRAVGVSDENAAREKARFLVVSSGLKINEPGCVESAIEFQSQTQVKAYGQRISFGLAQYYFKHNQLAKAIPYYEKAGIDNLTNTEIADEKFESAYCYFNNKQFDKAEPLFAYIKELKDGKYYIAGNYYYGLLAYNENKFEEALQSFDRIKDNKEYKSIVPYYVAEIHYFMGNKAKALELAKAIIEGRDKSFYDNDVHLLAAQCLFEDQKYADARPYFDYYYDHADKIKKEDLYKMGYCYYRLNDWQAATEKFKLLSSANDSLGQSSMYLLGDCYLKAGERQSARNAFGICGDMAFNKGQQEASMILYSRISYEEGYNDDALEELKTLMATFPSSQYADEANTLTSSLLLRTNNFEGSLKHLEAVTNKDKAYWEVYQKAAYGFAVQQFRKGNLDEASKYFKASVDHAPNKAPVDLPMESAAYFWMGELGFRRHLYMDAIAHSHEFLDRKVDNAALAVLSPQATVQHAYLNMGFAAMELKQFSEAQTYFNKAQQGATEDGYSGMLASLHEADAVFMQQNYVKGIALYDKIIKTDTDNADYARYQKSIILGLQGKNNDKINVLQSLINKTPVSAYDITARYEIAVTYIEVNKYPQALTNLQYLTDSAKDKSTAPKAWMKIGFISQQNNDNPKAINAYKHVVTDYPASDERSAALDALKSLYIQSNQPGAFAQLLKENNLPSAENSALDSTYYAAAETQFASGKWESAMHSLSDYLKEFPNGVFAIKAHYYRGESYYQLKNFKESLEDFNAVLSHPWNDFSENSAKHAASMAYDAGNFSQANEYYLKLRKNSNTNTQLLQVAYEGLIRSGFRTNKYAETISYTDSLLAMQGVSADMINDVLLYKAKSLQLTNKGDSSMSLYRQLSENKNGEIAAESRFRISEILLQQDSLKDAETAANETIRLSSGYDFWVVKSYILLADILIKQKDYFNAKATLTSIVKHTKNAELKQEATKKLADVKAQEKHHSKLKEE